MALIGAHVLGAAGQVLSGRLQRLALGAAWRPAAGVQVVSGVLAGPPNTQGELSLAGNVLTVQPFRAVLQSSLDATAGSYLVPNDAPVSFTMTAQHASQFRRALVVVRVDDSQVSGVASTATTDRAVLEVLDGGLAASAGATVLPTPAGSWLALGEVLIPPVGQTVTVTPYNPRTTTRGGILPVLADGSTITGHDGAAGAFDGQYRHHPAEGLQAWSAARTAWDGGWTAYTPVWTANNGTPVLGNGTLTGRYRRIGRHVELRIFLSWGSTTNGATGFYTFSLPFPAAASGVETILAAKYNVATFGNLQGFGLIAAAATVVTPYAPTSNTNLTQNAAQNRDATVVAGTGYPRVPSADPFVTGANIALAGSYECA